MGNSVTVIKVHVGDGVSYYKTPVRVMEILREHPEYVVTSMSKGKRIILSSEVNLQPGHTYYLVSPDHLFSATAESQIPSDQALSCCSRGYGKLYRVVAIYASTKSLLATAISKRNSLENKSSVAMCNLGDADQQPRRKRTLILKDNCIDDSKVMTLLQAPDAPAPRALTRALSVMSERSRSQNELRDVYSPTPDPSEFGSPQFLPLGHGIIAKVDEHSSSKRRSSFIANTGAELEKVSSSCIPWKSSKRLEPERGGTVSQTILSKEKWLEDMIRGADNQWKRNKPQAQGYTREGAECNELILSCERRLWERCLPSGGTLPTSDELYLDYSQCLTTPGSSPGGISFDMVAGHHDQQLIRHEDYPQDPQVAKSARLQLEIVEREQSVELDDRQHPLWLKMDEIERQFLKRLAPSASPPTAQSSLEKFPGNGAAARPRSLKFSHVDRG